MPAARLALVVGLAVAWALPALGQAMYKWIDAEGKVQYSDKRPKDFKGPVTIIQADDAPAPMAPPPKSAPAAASKDAVKPQQDLAAKRRATRDDLWARLIAARDKVESARKALAAGADPEPDERQVIQQQMKAGEGGMHGLSKARSNCRPMVKDGKNIVMCPATLATDAYYERQGRLEVALRQAEEDLAAAEEAYRRGVD